MMQTITKLSNSEVTMKAFLNATEILQINANNRAALIGVNPSTLTRNIATGFGENTKAFEIQLLLIRIYRSLYAIAGGDIEFMRHWFTTPNKGLNGKPSELVQSILGLARVNQYLDAMRGKV